MLKHFYSNYSATIIIIIAIITVGIIQFSQLPIALYPKCEKPKLRVSINTGTTEAKEFKEIYGKDVEAALNSVSNIITVKGNYWNGFVNYTIEFDWGIESDDAKNEVKNSLNAIESEFPESWGTIHYEFDGGESSMVAVSIFSKKYTPEQLVDIAETSIKSYLDRIEGLESTHITRFDEKYILITLDPYRLTSFGLNFNMVLSKLKSKKHDKSLGILDLKAGGSYQVTAIHTENNQEHLKNFIIGNVKNKAVRLKDIATITIKEDLPKQFFKANGRRSLLFIGTPKPGANIKKVSDAFIERINTHASKIDDTIEVHVILNPSSFINESVQNVIMAVMIGMGTAILTIFLFLGSLRNTIVISISIPLSLIAGFILMNAIGIEINLISLGAMALAVGMVVDGSIVVLENIFRHLQENPPHTQKQRLNCIIKATMEVRNPIIASLLTTIIVFIPLPFTSPIAAAILGDLAIVVVCVLSISIIVTLFFIPPLVMMLKLNGSTGNRKKGVYFFSFLFGFCFNGVERLYLKIIQVLLKYRIISFLVSVGFILLFGMGARLLVTDVKREIMARPQTDIIILVIDIKGERPDISDTETMLRPFEKSIMKNFKNDISHTLSIIRSNNPLILAFLKDKSQINSIKKAFEGHFKNTPKFNFHIEDWTPTSLEIPNPPLLHVNISGKNENEKRKLINTIKEILSESDDLGQKKSYPRTYQEDYLRIIFDEEKMIPLTTAGMNTSINSIEASISGLLNETYVKEMKIDGDIVDVMMQVGDDHFKSIGDIENMLLRVENKVVPLKTFARVDHIRDWGHYYTEDSLEINLVKAWAKESFNGDKEQLAENMKSAIKKHPDIDLSKVTFSNTQMEVNNNIRSLILSLIFALLLIFIVVTLQFGSILQTLIIMLAIPFGFLGVSYSLWFFESTLSVNSMLGLILLCGTAVNNSIIFLDFYNKIKKRDRLDIKEALFKTAMLRLRPIIITTATTTLGMLPISLGMGSGGEILKPLGIAICGGLWISTILTIIFIPLAIITFEKLIYAFSRLFFKKAITTSVAFIFMIMSFSRQGSAQQLNHLTLREAEKIAIDHHLELKASRYDYDASDLFYKSIYSEILPKLSIETEQYSIHHPQGDVKRVRFEEQIENPINLWLNRNIRKNDREIKASKVAEIKTQLLHDLRNTYFKLKITQLSLKNAVQNKKLAEKMFRSNRKRFNNGFIHKNDTKRAEVQYNRVLLSVKERTADLENVKERLYRFLELDKHHDITLTDQIPLKFKYFSLSKKNIFDCTLQGHSEKVKQLKLDLKNKNLSLKMANYAFLPDFTFGASYTKENYEDYRNESTAESILYAYAKWDLFTGGKRVLDRKAVLFEKKAAKKRLKHTQDDILQSIKETLRKLSVLKDQFTIQKGSIDLLSEILEESKLRFNKGIINSKQVNDDFSNFLDAQDDLFSIYLEIVMQISSLSKLSGDNSLFYKLF